MASIAVCKEDKKFQTLVDHHNNVAEYVAWFHENWFVSDQKKKMVGGIIFLYNYVELSKGLNRKPKASDGGVATTKHRSD